MTKSQIKIRSFAFLVIFPFFSLNSFGQGCSDAGFCTIDGFKPFTGNNVDMTSHQIKIGFFYGNADHTISVYGNYLEYNRQVNNKLGIDLKLSSLIQKGNNISSSGISDVFINGNYKVSENLKITLGSKIPLSNADKTNKTLPLPMDYQSSLGTLDLIFGIGYAIKSLHLVAAMQQPLTQNSNQFIASNYPLNSELRTFQSTHTFKRSGDVLLRASYPISVTPKFKLTPSILPIYHLKDDQFVDELNVEKEIQGSQGLTLNGNIYLDYEINSRNILQINFGTPFIFRDSRPDGLTRKFIGNLEYRIKF